MAETLILLLAEGVPLYAEGVAPGVSASYPAYGAAPAPSYDPAALAFINAAGLTADTHKDAVNRLVLDLKAASLFTPTKIQALWPLLGGTADAHRYNLLDPATFPLTYGPGMQHSALGLAGGGSLALTGYVASRDMVDDTLHLAVYVRALTDDPWDMGSVETETQVQGLLVKRAAIAGSDIGDDGSFTNVPLPTAPGFFIGSRTSRTSHVSYQNGAAVGSNSSPTPAPMNRCTAPMALCGASGTNGGASAKPIALASIGPGLSASEVAAYATAVQRYQTALGRQV